MRAITLRVIFAAGSVVACSAWDGSSAKPGNSNGGAAAAGSASDPSAAGASGFSASGSGGSPAAGGGAGAEEGGHPGGGSAGVAGAATGGSAGAATGGSAGAAGADALATCQKCASAHPSCACATAACVQCLFVDAADAASCAGVPFGSRNLGCSCLASACKAECPPTCQY